MAGTPAASKGWGCVNLVSELGFRESEKKDLKRKKIKKNKNSLTSHALSPSSSLGLLFILYFVFFFSFFYVGPTCPFISLLGPFQPRNNLFCPGFNFLSHN